MPTVSTEIHNPICVIEFEADAIRDCALYMADMIELAEAIDPGNPVAQAQFTAQLREHLFLLKRNASIYARLIAAIEAPVEDTQAQATR